LWNIIDAAVPVFVYIFIAIHGCCLYQAIPTAISERSRWSDCILNRSYVELFSISRSTSYKHNFEKLNDLSEPTALNSALIQNNSSNGTTIFIHSTCFVLLNIKTKHTHYPSGPICNDKGFCAAVLIWSKYLKWSK